MPATESGENLVHGRFSVTRGFTIASPPNGCAEVLPLQGDDRRRRGDVSGSGLFSVLGGSAGKGRKGVPGWRSSKTSDRVGKVSGHHVVVHGDGLSFPRDLRGRPVAGIEICAGQLSPVLIVRAVDPEAIERVANERVSLVHVWRALG